MVNEGFGSWGEEHDILVPESKNDQDGNVQFVSKGKTKLCLFPNQHLRILNADETGITSFKITNGRTKLIFSERLPQIGADSPKKEGSIHVSLNAAIRAPEYRRVDTNGETIDFKNAEMLPMQVEFLLLKFQIILILLNFLHLCLI